MHTRAHIRIALITIIFLLQALGAFSQQMQPSPKFSGTSFPLPPKQNAEWAAPADAPAELISASNILFGQGLADPRGCVYCEIEVTVGDCWRGDGGVIKVHGWLLPANPSDTQRFAVAWNGLVYPVIKIGAKVDIHTDIAEIIKADADTRAAQKKRNPYFQFFRVMNAMSEGVTIAPSHLNPVQACMVMRLGNGNLANQLWNTWNTGVSPETPKDPYLMLATEWTWSLYNRAVNAHMRGDDGMALASATELKRIQPLVEAKCAKLGFKKTEYSDSYRMGQYMPYLSFIDRLDMLISDSQRRLAEKLTPELSQSTSQAERIAAMISKLDQVDERQMGQPGGVMLGASPTVKSLIAEGNAAIEPLIDCIGNDTRLTRSVGFGRDFRTLKKGEN